MDKDLQEMVSKKHHFKQVVRGMSEEEFRMTVLMALDAIEGRVIDIQSKWGLK